MAEVTWRAKSRGTFAASERITGSYLIESLDNDGPLMKEEDGYSNFPNRDVEYFKVTLKLPAVLPKKNQEGS